MKPGLAELKNAIVVPHIASASKVTKNSSSWLNHFSKAINHFMYMRVFAVDPRGNGNTSSS